MSRTDASMTLVRAIDGSTSTSREAALQEELHALRAELRALWAENDRLREALPRWSAVTPADLAGLLLQQEETAP